MATEQVPQDNGTPPNLPPRDGRFPPPGRVIPFPAGAPTREEADAVNAGEYAPRGLERVLHGLARNWAMRLGLTAGGLYVAQQIPEIRQLEQVTIDGIQQQINSLWKHIRPQSIEDKFPNKLEPSAFTTPLSTETDIRMFIPTIDLDKYRGVIGFPLDRTTVQESPNLRYNSFFDRVPLLPYINEKVTKAGVLNAMQFTSLPKGTIIYAPIDGSVVAISIAGVKQVEGQQTYTPAYTALALRFRDKDGKICGITLSGLHAKPLIDIKPYPRNYSPSPETGTRIGLFQPILELTTELQDWDGKGNAFPTERGQVVIHLFCEQQEPRALIPLTIDFPRDTNGNILVTERLKTK